MARKFAWWSALPLALAAPAPAIAQSLAVAESDGEANIAFSADSVAYDSDAEIVTATGQVRMARDGQYLAADTVTWNRRSGEVAASGNVVLVNAEGDKLVSDRFTLTDTLRDGTVENLLLVLENGGRIAATRAVRSGDVTSLENAFYSPCAVTNDNGCPKKPSWAISAARVVDDRKSGKIRFEGGRFQLFGISLPLLPIFAVPKGSGGASGWLVPDFSLSTRKGLEIALPYHWRFSSARDFTLTPHIYTGVAPAIEAKYRELNSIGAWQVGGFLTYGTIEDADTGATSSDGKGLRAYVEHNGKWQFDPYWSLTTALRVVSDRTVTRRYDISNDDRLRNVVNLERIAPDSYISVAGWAFQGLRSDDRQRSIPFALPAMDARFRFNEVAGGVVEVEANSLAITRIDGQDTQRAFGSVRWDMRKLTPMGQLVTLTALGRADVYHSDETVDTTVAIYRGMEGWHSRAIAALAGEVAWPFAGPAFGGTQRITPKLQVVFTPRTDNRHIPNEDSRSVDLEDSNLFALSRFPGYDRWEDQSRMTYGVDWALDRPNLTITTTVGQSYRLISSKSIFPDGTGLTGRFSDIVGRTRVRVGRLVDFTHRFRLDKNNLAVRRNEVDLTVGSDQTYAQIGYLKLNRNVDSAVEDLRDKEELRLAARVLFAKYWSVFGSTVIDLTDKREDPLSLADGWETVRHRLGFLYADDCLEIGLTWRRDHQRIGTLNKGSTFSLHLALHGLSR